MKIALLTDSSADINKEEAIERNLHILRFPLIVDAEDYIEGETITLEDFTQRMYDGAHAKTSQPSVGVLLETWDNLLKEYDHVIYACISKGISGAYQTAVAQSRNYEGKVTVLDTKSVAYPHQTLCSYIHKMIDLGYSPEKIKEEVEASEKMYALLIPGDLKYLKRGGRISAQAAALAGLLKIVPILKVEEGEIDVFDKVRTSKKALERALSVFAGMDNYEDYHWYVIHSDAIEKAEELAGKLKELTGQPVDIKEFYPIIMAHTGPGTVALGRIRKFNYE